MKTTPTTDTGLRSLSTAMRRILSCSRCATGGALVFVVVMVSLCRLLLVTENYADTLYWTPSNSLDDDRLHVHLRWRPEIHASPVVNSQGCSVDMSIDPTGYSPTRDIRLAELSDELTVVTAYFYIPEYKKRGSSSKLTTRDLYRQWMSVFALIENRLIVYVDNDEDYDYFRSVRRHFPANRTCLVQLDRTRMWAFSPANRQRVQDITRRDDYFKFYPNTVIADYSLTQNAKYEVIQMSIRRNPYRTRYITWLDIGLFRDVASTASIRPSSSTDVEAPPGQRHFRLDLPPGFNSNRSIGFSEVRGRDRTLTPKAVVFHTKVWVSGAYFVGRVDRMYQWTLDYLHTYEWLVANNLTNTDEQVIYALHNAVDQRILRPTKSKLQLYKADGRFSPYFNVGYQSRVMLGSGGNVGRYSTAALLVLCQLTMILLHVKVPS